MRRQQQILSLLIFAGVRALLRCGADCEDLCSSYLWVLVRGYCVCVCVCVGVCLSDATGARALHQDVRSEGRRQVCAVSGAGLNYPQQYYFVMLPHCIFPFHDTNTPTHEHADGH